MTGIDGLDSAVPTGTCVKSFIPALYLQSESVGYNSPTDCVSCAPSLRVLYRGTYGSSLMFFTLISLRPFIFLRRALEAG
jgi:hypothetical protein